VAAAFRSILLREDWRSFPLGFLAADETARGEYMCRVVPDSPNGWYQPGRELNIRPPANPDQSFWRVRRSGRGRAVEQPLVTPGECLLLTTGERPWRDLGVKAELKCSGERASGLVARYFTSRDFYAMVMEAGRLKLLRRLEGVYTSLADCPAPPAPAAAAGRSAWELRCEGERITARLGGRIVLEARDGAITSGGVGILGNAPIVVGEITVRGPVSEARREVAEARRAAASLKRSRRGVPKAELVAEIDLRGRSCGRQLRFADLDGDGRDEVIVAVPAPFPKRKRSYWQIGLLSALGLDGRVLWERGRLPEALPHIASDLPVQAAPRGGKMEVVAALGHELHLIDPVTGRTRRKVSLPRVPRQLPYQESYNSAVQDDTVRVVADSLRLCNASGRGPHDDILVKDRHHNAWVLDGRTLRPRWHYRCNTGHFCYTADLDGDGRDEFFLGYARLDHRGRRRWSVHLADHPDGTFAYIDHEGGYHVMHAAGDVGLVDDVEFRGYREVPLGHVQHLSVANFCPERPGLERLVVTYWNGPGIIVLLDGENRALRKVERVGAGAVCQPVNWTGDGRELIAFSPRIGDGGLWNEHFELMVPLPGTDRPELCMEVHDVLGLGVDQLVIWDDERLQVYAPDRLSRRGSKRYRPRRPAPNWSNYQVNFSLPHWEPR